MEENVVPPLPPRYRFRDLIKGESSPPMEDDTDRVMVEYFTYERTFKERLYIYFIQNQRSSLRIRIFNLFIKVLSCILYILRVTMDNPRESKGCCDMCINHTWAGSENDNRIHWSVVFFVERTFTLWIIQVVVACISLAEMCLVTYLSYKGNLLHSILSPSFLLEMMLSLPFIVSTVDHRRLKCLFVPVFLNCWLAKQQLENMFGDLNRMFQRSSSMVSQRILSVASTSMCIIFTSVCGIQHLQRGGGRHFNMFESLWFVMVTFSTVGYGDYRPDIWPSQSFMIVMIVIAITVLPSQLEKLAFSWMERSRMGGEYSRHRARTEKHVVVCTTALHADTIMDFLNEFYAHPKLQDFYVVLLSPCVMDSTMKMILMIPIWAERVIYIRGSALKDSDLTRCRLQDAEACFILAARNYQDRNAADQHTIMRSWAVKDFAPSCPQYVQLYRPENKFHVHFAEYVVCEDEFKYALLANNALCPGLSTLVTLLLHTSRGTEGRTSREPWHNLYGKCSGNEIYHIVVKDSGFFSEFIGKSFTYASFHAHKKYGVGLVGVRTSNSPSILLNPGPRHLMEANDVCFYLSITKEENSTLLQQQQQQQQQLQQKPSPNSGLRSDPTSVKSAPTDFTPLSLKMQLEESKCVETPKSNDLEMGLQSRQLSEEGNTEKDKLLQETENQKDHNEQSKLKSLESNKRTKPNTLCLPMEDLNVNRSQAGNDGGTQLRGSVLSRKPSIAAVPDYIISDAEYQRAIRAKYYSHDEYNGDLPECVKGCPPVIPYIGSSPCLCHLVKEKRPLCCLQLSQSCEHCSNECAHDYGWHNRSVIVCADYAGYGLFNFIIPLRSHWRAKDSLKPIVLLLETVPDNYFLEGLSYFPLVYWMKGYLEDIDSLLKAGINFSDNVVVVNKESSNSAEEETLSDCNTIVAVQSVYRLFPSTKIITELSQSSNMRFTQFRADDPYNLSMSKMEKKERNRGSSMAFMFRLAFAGGNVFSANMLDTLLYQAYVKDYIITFIRLLLGIDQAVGSGHLTMMTIGPDDMWIRTYGRLYQRMCSSTCEVPIGIFRTIRKKTTPSATSDLTSCQTKILEKQEITQMVHCHMVTLDLPLENYQEEAEHMEKISFPIINPPFDLPLEEGDMIYLLRPSSLSDQPSPLIDERKLQQGDFPPPSHHRASSSIRRRRSPSMKSYQHTWSTERNDSSATPPVELRGVVIPHLHVQRATENFDHFTENNHMEDLPSFHPRSKERSSERLPHLI